MGITITDYGLNTTSTTYSVTDSPAPPPNQIAITKFTNTEIDIAVATYTGVIKGVFDTSSFRTTPSYLSDITNSNASLLISSFTLSNSGAPVRTEVFSPQISFTDFNKTFYPTSNNDFISLLQGNDTYITSNNGNDTSSNTIHLYAGNDTIYENQKLLKYPDVFYGGDGIDTVVYSSKASNFSILTSNNIWDDQTQKANLSGFVITDNTKSVNTLQVTQVEKIQFADQTIDLTPFIPTAQKGVTIQFSGSHSIATAYYPANTGAPPPDQIKIIKFNSTEIDFSVTAPSGISYTGIFYGLFDTSIFTKQPQTVSDLLNKGSSLLANNFIINDSNGLVRTEAYAKAVTIDDFWAWTNGSSSNIFVSFLNGDDTFITSNNGDDTASLVAYTYAGNDKFYENQKVIKYSDFFYGGDGIDTAVYSNKSSNFTITSSNKIWDDQAQKSNLSGFIISDNTKTINTLQINQVEKIQFSDFTLDTTSLTKTAALSHTNIVNLVELYIASFNRAPDSVGLDYWGGRFSDGMSLQDIAKSFFVQPETVAAYPSNMPTSDFVTKVYNNVLSRGPDAGGLNYWVGELNNGHVTKDSFLLAIINGAMAPTGSAVDRQTLANKEAVGEHYAIYQGLNNSTNWAKDVMSGVTDQMATVTAANAKSDGYAAVAANPATSDLVVKLVGVAV